jgi:hypothetical protein
MQNESDSLADLRRLWTGEGSSRDEVEAACGPGKTCRNMRHVDFEAASFQSGSDTGADLGQAWRAKLEREGKLRPGAGSLGDLIRSKVGGTF